jgi:medium-chain acyl-[acyl-carrier-protein] hydrolase
MTILIEAVVANLKIYLDHPFAFFGHSLGALMAFDMARYLRKHFGVVPVHLFVSGCRAPQLPHTGPPFHALPDAEFIREVERMNGTPKEVLQNRELIQLMLPLLRADFALSQEYTYVDEPPLACPISAFGGVRDQEVNLESVQAWREQTTNRFSFRRFPGDHFFLHTEPMLLLSALAQELQRITWE